MLLWDVVKRTTFAMPGCGAVNDLVNRIDPVELALALSLNAWLTPPWRVIISAVVDP